MPLSLKSRFCGNVRMVLCRERIVASTLRALAPKATTLQLAAAFKSPDALEASVGLLQSVGSPTTLCKFAKSCPHRSGLRSFPELTLSLGR